jgi:hypothetical protein
MTFGALPIVRVRAPGRLKNPFPARGNPMQARALVLSVLCFLPGTLLGQDDSASFHPGQWAMQFGGGSSLFNLGVLRFTSPKSAWLLDFDVTAVLVSGKFTDISGTSDADDKSATGLLRLGRRSYHRPRGKVVAFHSVAAEFGYQYRKLDLGGGSRQVINQWSTGLYTDVGAAYRLTSSLSLGGNASVSGGYVKRKIEQPLGTLKGNGFYFQGLQVLFAVGIYF